VYGLTWTEGGRESNRSTLEYTTRVAFRCVQYCQISRPGRGKCSMEMLYSGYMHSYCTHHFFLCGTLAETPPGAHEEQSADDHKEADTTNGPADRSGP
jgi:hypothetical protein